MKDQLTELEAEQARSRPVDLRESLDLGDGLYPWNMRGWLSP